MRENKTFVSQGFKIEDDSFKIIDNFIEHCLENLKEGENKIEFLKEYEDRKKVHINLTITK